MFCQQLLHPTVFQLFLYCLFPFWPLFLFTSPSTNLATIPSQTFLFLLFPFFFVLFFFFGFLVFWFFCSFPFSFPFSESRTAPQRANYDILLNYDILIPTFRFRHCRCCKDFISPSAEEDEVRVIYLTFS